MFNGCSKLTEFTSKLRSLKSGVGMFSGCSKLNANSLDVIATHINDISDLDKENDSDWTLTYGNYNKVIKKENRGRIDIDYDTTISQDVISICFGEIMEKGWEIYVN